MVRSGRGGSVCDLTVGSGSGCEFLASQRRFAPWQVSKLAVSTVSPPLAEIGCKVQLQPTAVVIFIPPLTGSYTIAGVPKIESFPLWPELLRLVHSTRTISRGCRIPKPALPRR